MVKVAVFGSTGKTGLQIVQQALERGYTVVAAARSPQKLTIQHEALAAVACDVLQPDSLAAVMFGVDAVIVAIGGDGISDSRTRSEGTANILQAMRAAEVDRILAVSTAGVGDSIDQLGMLARVFVRLIIHKAVADHTRQEKSIRSSGMRWTIGRPGGLTDGARSGGCQADPDGTISIRQVSRADVASFLLDALEDPQSEGQIYALSQR